MAPGNKSAIFDQPSCYRISVLGQLSANLSHLLGDLAITMSEAPSQQPVTTLTGEVRDQAALLGVLNSLYDFGCPLLTVERLSNSPVSEDASQRVAI